jgi:hypothetical protein
VVHTSSTLQKENSLAFGQEDILLAKQERAMKMAQSIKEIFIRIVDMEEEEFSTLMDLSTKVVSRITLWKDLVPLSVSIISMRAAGREEKWKEQARVTGTMTMMNF